MCPGPLYVAHWFFHGFGCCVFHKSPKPLKELGSFTQVADNFRKEKTCHSGAVGSQPCSSFHAQNVMRITKCLLCSWILNIRRENHKFFKACIHLWKSKVQYEKCWLHINACFSWKSINKTMNSRMGKILITCLYILLWKVKCFKTTDRSIFHFCKFPQYLNRDASWILRSGSEVSVLWHAVWAKMHETQHCLTKMWVRKCEDYANSFHVTVDIYFWDPD